METGQPEERSAVPFPAGTGQAWILIGVAGTTFTLIFLQIILFRLLTSFGGYLTANSVISIALLGIAVGGLIGWRASRDAPLQTMIRASFWLPFAILLTPIVSPIAFGVPFLASVLLMPPFVCASAVITVALARARSHVIYCIDLLGAATGALLVGPALSLFREESSLLFLSGFAYLILGCFIMASPTRYLQRRTFVLVCGVFLSVLALGTINLRTDWLNLVRFSLLAEYPKVEVLFSRSSLAGRIDIVRRTPTRKDLQTYENGYTIDTIRRLPRKQHQIDPRMPHTLMEDPVILILGLSGDGVSKTATRLGKQVYGVEINPDVVELHTNELVEFNSNNYDGIDVSVMDARSYMAQSHGKYDIITLMNTHGSRGRTAKRAPSPEYLHTREAMESYLEHLTDRGIILIEEPVSKPSREPPVWKLLVTMREALIAQGSDQPERHFFVFQWRTYSNNYLQLVVSKSPLTNESIARLRAWLKDVDDIREIGMRTGHRMGPIFAKTTVLYSPDESFSNNYSRLIRGEADQDLREAYNLYATTDDRPFHFDVDPAHRTLKWAYLQTLLMVCLLFPFIFTFLRRYRSTLRGTLPHVLVVALTGMGYLLIEVVLMQRYEIFLGSPAVAFAAILGTLLIFSGLGSLWSGGIGRRGIVMALVAVLVFLVLHRWWDPSHFRFAVSLPLYLKVTLAVASLAPLAFFMGVPFPFVLRTSKLRLAESAAAMLFAINGATSALAVPLSMNISTSYGLSATFQVGVVIYIAVGILLVSVDTRKLQRLTNGLAVLLISLLALSPWMSHPSTVGKKPVPNEYHVRGICYGTSYRWENQARRRDDSKDTFLVRLAKASPFGSLLKEDPFAWLFWVLEGNGRTILVDTGFDDRALAAEWGIADYTQPIERLRQLGMTPDDISDIILTDAHWHHTGNLTHFRNARIWIQEDEYRHALSLLSAEAPDRETMRRQDIEQLIAAEREGRLELIRGEKVLAPGITVTLGGSHTIGSQYVTVETRSGPAIIAGDSVGMVENNQKHRPSIPTLNRDANLATLREMQRKAASPFLILPGHDSLVMKWFPCVGKGIVDIRYQ